MSFRTTGRENSNAHNFLPNLHNNPSTFLILRSLLLREFRTNPRFVSNFLQDGSNFGHQQEKIRQGWSLLSTLHCLLLSGKLVEKGSNTFKKPNVEQLAIRYNILFYYYYSTSCSPDPTTNSETTTPKFPRIWWPIRLCLKKKIITKEQTRLVKHVLKVRKFKKQIFLFSFELKTEWNYFLISALRV